MSLLAAPIPANLFLCLEVIIDISNVNIIPPAVIDYLFANAGDAFFDFNNRFDSMDIFKIITFMFT